MPVTRIAITPPRLLSVLGVMILLGPPPALEGQPVRHAALAVGVPNEVALDPQEALRSFGRAGTGLGAGVAFGAVAFSGILTSGSGNACTGSGDYLQFCRVVFVGGTALSGALGALVGGLIRSESPSGRARQVLLGAALGSVVPFVVSLPLCSQSDQTNPGVLCGSHGMTQPGVTLVSGVAGGLVGYVLAGRSQRLSVRHLGPTPLPGTGMGITFAVAW